MSRVRVDSRHTYSVHWTAPFCVPWGRRGGTKPHAGRREGVVRTTTARETRDLRLSLEPGAMSDRATEIQTVLSGDPPPEQERQRTACRTRCTRGAARTARASGSRALR